MAFQVNDIVYHRDFKAIGKIVSVITSRKVIVRTDKGTKTWLSDKVFLFFIQENYKLILDSNSAYYGSKMVIGSLGENSLEMLRSGRLIISKK